MQGFEIDQKNFRAQNIGRPAAHLIRELIQNAFDEQPPPGPSACPFWREP